MSDFLIRLDSLFDKEFKKLEKSLKVTLLNSIKKKTNNKIVEITKHNPTSPLFNLKFQELTTTTNTIVKNLVKNVTVMTETEIARVSQLLGVEIPRIEFMKNIQNNIYNFTNQIPAKVRGGFFDYVSISLVEPTTAAMEQSLANMIGKTVKQTNRLVSESITQMNREYTSNIYKKVLPERQLYEYVGPLDGSTSTICRTEIGNRRTMDEWLSAYPGIAIEGLHFGCRHWLVPVYKGEE